MAIPEYRPTTSPVYGDVYVVAAPGYDVNPSKQFRVILFSHLVQYLNGERTVHAVAIIGDFETRAAANARRDELNAEVRRMNFQRAEALNAHIDAMEYVYK